MTDISPKPPAGEVYLGDAVYASFDGYHIWLRCTAPPCTIALDPSVYINLRRFVRQIGGHDLDPK